jgi:glyoxylase-like metal-dependent hydrolase (beta-lactamase superfamily II)
MGALLLAAWLVAPEGAPPPRFAVQEVAPGVFAAIADPKDESSLGNAGFVIGSDGVLVVDTFATPAAAERLLAEIRSKTRLPVRFVVNTHFHRDHIGGNAVFAKAGAAVLAHENVRAWARREWQTDLTPEERSRYAGLRLPDVTYRDRCSVWLGDRRVEIFHRPGHTGSDSIVAVPDARVVFAGDLVLKNCIANVSLARTDAWVATLDELLREYPSAVFVPGHGDVARPLDVRLFRDYLSSLRLAVARAKSEGKSGAALVEAVLPRLSSRYSGWTWFEYVEGSIADVEAELNGTKAYPPAPTP